MMFILYLAKFWTNFGIFCYWTNFLCCKWPNIVQIIHQSSHTGHSVGMPQFKYKKFQWRSILGSIDIILLCGDPINRVQVELGRSVLASQVYLLSSRQSKNLFFLCKKSEPICFWNWNIRRKLLALLPTQVIFLRLLQKYIFNEQEFS